MSQPEHVEGGRDNAALLNGGYVPKMKPFGEVSASFHHKWTTFLAFICVCHGQHVNHAQAKLRGLEVCPISAVPHLAPSAGMGTSAFSVRNV